MTISMMLVMTVLPLVVIASIFKQVVVVASDMIHDVWR